MAKTKKQKEEVADLAEIVNDTKISEKPEKIDEQELAQLQSSVNKNMAVSVEYNLEY